MPRRNRLSPQLVSVDHVVDQVAASLRCLGDTAGEVHWTLLHDGVHGARHATTFLNPVVRYLNRRLDVGGTMEIPRGASELTLHLREEVFRVPLPSAVAEFLDRFHAGMHLNVTDR